VATATKLDCSQDLMEALL